jgi:hypothetical protein
MRQIMLPLLVSLSLAACSTKEGPGSSPAATVSATGPAAAMPKHDDHGAAVEGAHQDHNARYGGLVTMEGENHVEVVVGADGAIDLYVSDAVRKPISPKDVSGTITIESKEKKEKQTLSLTQDDAKGSLSAKGPVPDGANYTWDLKVRGAPMRMTLAVPVGGTATFAKHPDGDHPHGSPNGGVVQSLAGGHVEVKVEKSGDVTLWMLDSTEKPRPAKGVAASLRPVVAGAKEATLAYDEKLDALRGKIDPIQQDHVDAILSITPAGGSATSLRFTFHLEGTTKSTGHEGHMDHEGH